MTLIARVWMQYQHSKPETIHRVCRFRPHHVLPHVNRRLESVRILNKPLKFYSRYLLTFKHKGIVCAGCGMKGEWVYLERSHRQDAPGIYHLKLYGVNEHGVEVLFTMDHIIPVSKGGKNSLRNIQPMCFECNQEKGNNITYKSKKRNKRRGTPNT